MVVLIPIFNLILELLKAIFMVLIIALVVAVVDQCLELELNHDNQQPIEPVPQRPNAPEEDINLRYDEFGGLWTDGLDGFPFQIDGNDKEVGYEDDPSDLSDLEET